jgi:hypothetical protein
MREMAAADVTYAEIGATAGVLPPGYKHGSYGRVLPVGIPPTGYDGERATCATARGW